MEKARKPATEVPVPAVLGLRRRRIAVASGALTYVDEGAGAPIVLLHGAPITSLGFVRMIRVLRERHRVIAPDLPGFGDSVPSAAFEGTLAAYAASIEEFVRALGLRGFVMFVNDSSGCMGLSAAARLAPLLAGVVVADTVPLPLTGRAWPVKIALRFLVSSLPVRLLNRRLNLLPWLVSSVAPFANPLCRTERRALRAQFDTREKRDRILDVFRAMGRDDDFMRRTAQATATRLADTPALIVFGQFDPMRLAGGVSRFRRLLPRSTVALIPREEHFPFLSSGERVAREIAGWMGRLEPARDDGGC